MRRTATIGTVLVAAACAGSSGPAAAPTPTWQGRYRYEHDSGRTAGGSAILVTYELTLARAAGHMGCRVSSSGFQTDETLVCRARPAAGGSLAIDFHRYADGRLVNRYGVAVYRPGQTLFSLRQGPDGQLLTHWQAQRPDPETRAPGLFFRKVR